jgi:hypothetical protein
MQYRKPVGLGLSLNTCPKRAPHLLHITSIRLMKKLSSNCSLIFSSLIGVQKLGHPVPESNFASDLNKSFSQQTHL